MKILFLCGCAIVVAAASASARHQVTFFGEPVDDAERRPGGKELLYGGVDIVGISDWTTFEAEQIVSAVRADGRPVWYMKALNEGHGFVRKENTDLMRNAVAFFFEQHLPRRQ